MRTYSFQAYLTRPMPNGKTESTWIVRNALDFTHARTVFNRDFPGWTLTRLVNYCSCPMA